MFFLGYDPSKFKGLRVSHTRDIQDFVDAFNALHPDPLHISKQNVSQWETGKHLPNVIKFLHVMRFMAKPFPEAVVTANATGQLIIRKTV